MAIFEKPNIGKGLRPDTEKPVPVQIKTVPPLEEMAYISTNQLRIIKRKVFIATDNDVEQYFIDRVLQQAQQNIENGEIIWEDVPEVDE